MNMYSYQHGVYQTIYHLTWQTKYRYKMMRKEKYRLAVRQAIEEVGARYGIHFLELAVMVDHVHAVVSCHPSMSQSKALGLLKGGSAASPSSSESLAGERDATRVIGGEPPFHKEAPD